MKSPRRFYRPNELKFYSSTFFSMNEIKNKANHTNYKLSTLFPKFSFSHIALRNKS